MGRARWAEWILARCTDGSRAASIVGDLLEMTAERGSFAFWFPVVRIVISFVWLRTLAFVAAFYVGLFSITEFRELVYGTRWVHPPPGRWAPPIALVWLEILLCIAASYAVIRYGIRDTFAQLAAAFCCLMTLTIISGWKPIVTVVCILLAASVLIVSVRSARWSRALVALVAALAFGFAGSFVALQLQRMSLDVFAPYAVPRWVDVCYQVLTIWTVTAPCAWAHKRIIQRDQETLGVEP
jgi:hypothetical protein